MGFGTSLKKRAFPKMS